MRMVSWRSIVVKLEEYYTNYPSIEEKQISVASNDSHVISYFCRLHIWSFITLSYLGIDVYFI